MGKLRILIVDDHGIVRAGRRSRLEAQPDLEVIGEAARGEEALEKAMLLHPDLVLMDIAMPGMNGIEATRRIKSELPDVRVLVLTIHDDEEFFFPVLRAGASGYILKSSTREQLVRAIRTACDNQVPIDAAVAADVLGNDTHTEAFKAPPLTQRQVDVLRLAAARIPYRDIAAHLSISEATVGIEMRRVFELRPWLFRGRPTRQTSEQARTTVR